MARRLANGLLLACTVANTWPVGAALGTYGLALFPYVPQLPLEWAGLALGASSWIVEQHRGLSGSGRLVWLGLLMLVLVAAAVVETVVPI